MSHPTPDDLRDFVLGALDDAAEREVRDHLASGCDSCRVSLQAEAALDHAMWETRQAEHAAGAGGDMSAVVVELPPSPGVPRWAMGGGLAVAASALVAVGLVWTAGNDEAPAPTAAAAPMIAGATAPPAGAAAAAVTPATVAAPTEPPSATPGAAAPPAAEPVATAMPEQPPAEKKPAKKTASATRRPRAKAARAPAPPPPTKPRARARGCDPILDLDCPEKGAGGGGAKKRTLASTDVLGVVRKNLGDISRCGVTHDVTGTVRMEWRIMKSGRTSSVRVLTPDYVGTPVGQCMTKEVKKWRFPAFTGTPPPPVKFPFKLKGAR